MLERTLTGCPATIARRRPAGALLEAAVRTTNGYSRGSRRRATAAMNQRECRQQESSSRSQPRHADQD